MSEQIKVNLTFNFADEGEPEEMDLISVNGGEPKELTLNIWDELKNLCETRRQIYEEVIRNAESKSKRQNLNQAKRRQVEKLGW